VVRRRKVSKPVVVREARRRAAQHVKKTMKFAHAKREVKRILNKPNRKHKVAHKKRNVIHAVKIKKRQTAALKAKKMRAAAARKAAAIRRAH